MVYTLFTSVAQYPLPTFSNPSRTFLKRTHTLFLNAHTNHLSRLRTTTTTPPPPLHVCFSSPKPDSQDEVITFSALPKIKTQLNNQNSNCFLLLQENGEGLQILKRWDVPWEWQTVSLTSLACGLRCVLSFSVSISVEIG